MIRIDDGTEVGASAEDTFAFVTRLEGFPAWLPGVLAAESLGVPDAAAGAAPAAPGADGRPAARDPGAAGPATTDAVPVAGARFRLVSEGPGGIRIVSEGRVQAVDPPRSIAITASSGFFALSATCRVSALGAGGSRVDVHAEIEPRGLATLAAGRIEQELRAAVPDSLRRLREALERRPA